MVLSAHPSRFAIPQSRLTETVVGGLSLGAKVQRQPRVQGYLRERNPLADGRQGVIPLENKRDPDYPFAFLKILLFRAGTGTTHAPLRQALRSSPAQRTARHSFLCCNRFTTQPTEPWVKKWSNPATSQSFGLPFTDAYKLLKDTRT